ncbi:xyloglucan-specific galacturonosyltransferase 1-like [Apium graveolens]|uniref:xyloglucan-specific galacturonosyltransferase 1-like n=1 Tax=Apium graveolens TaxID=4045 RepID=UPI003D78B557
MALSLSKKRAKYSKRAAKELGFFQFILSKLLSRLPLTLLLLVLVFLWSSTTTIISGHIVHVCVSSRKLNSLYCLSAGAQPNFDIPLPLINASSVDDHKLAVSIRGSVPSVDIKNNATLVTQEIASYVVQENNIDDHKLKVSIRENGPVDINDDKVLVTKDIPGYNVQENNKNLIVNNIVHNNNNTLSEFESAVKVVEEHLQVHRSWRSNSSSLTTCDGRGVYVYDLPPKFNKDLVAQCSDMSPWLDFCQFFRNEALGEPIPKLGKAWYNTHQYSLEPIFHSRVMKHPCRVYNENEAKLFYVPFYGGLDILRWHFKNASPDVKDTLALDLVEWLKLQKPWALNSGKDHVFVLGKVSWDFRRRDDSPWGSTFLNLEEMQNPIKLLIERQPWHVNDIGIPHPTYFHPHSDEDIISWQFKIIQSSRNNLVSFAGGARPDSPDSIRSVLINQCTLARTGTCKFQNCSSGGCDQPESIIELFLESEFCLQPPGDSPTRKSVFDSLISGCIPVFFDPFTAYYQYSWHLPEDHGKYSMFIDQEEVRKSKVNVVEWLMKIPKKARDDMRRYIVYELLPGLVYGDSSSDFEQFQDAFSITTNNLLEKVTRLG